MRVAAFAAVAALLLQVSCLASLPAVSTVQVETHGDSGCHESAPPTPDTPDPSHICCSGDHSPDALLSAVVTPASIASDGRAVELTSPLRFFAPSFADFSASFSPPHGSFALRI
jgi:hypothetical protein